MGVPRLRLRWGQVDDLLRWFTVCLHDHTGTGQQEGTTVLILKQEN